MRTKEAKRRRAPFCGCGRRTAAHGRDVRTGRTGARRRTWPWPYGRVRMRRAPGDGRGESEGTKNCISSLQRFDGKRGPNSFECFNSSYDGDLLAFRVLASGASAIHSTIDGCCIREHMSGRICSSVAFQPSNRHSMHGIHHRSVGNPLHRLDQTKKRFQFLLRSPNHSTNQRDLSLQRSCKITLRKNSHKEETWIFITRSWKICIPPQERRNSFSTVYCSCLFKNIVT